MHGNEIETKENGLRNLTEGINYPLKAISFSNCNNSIYSKAVTVAFFILQKTVYEGQPLMTSITKCYIARLFVRTIFLP